MKVVQCKKQVSDPNSPCIVAGSSVEPGSSIETGSSVDIGTSVDVGSSVQAVSSVEIGSSVVKGSSVDVQVVLGSCFLHALRTHDDVCSNDIS